MFANAKKKFPQMTHAKWTGTSGDVKWKTKLMSVAAMMDNHRQTLVIKGKVMSADKYYTLVRQEYKKEIENKIKFNGNIKDYAIAKIPRAESTKSNISDRLNTKQSHAKSS